MKNKRTAQEIVLRNLSTGNHLQLEGYTLGMDTEDNPVIVAKKYKNGEEETIGLYLDPAVFVQMCKNLTEDDLFTICANTALTTLAHKQY